MSKSKEASEREQNKAANQQNVESTQNQQTDQFNQRVGARGQTDYTQGRESARDFPRRSTSQQYREEAYRQRTNPSQPSNRWATDNRNQPGGTSGYENRNLRREDTGDFYSRSIREGRRSDFDRNRQSYEPRQAYGHQENFRQANQPDYDRSSQAANYGSQSEPQARPYRNEERENRSAYNRGGYDLRSSPEEYNYNRTDQYGDSYGTRRASFGLENEYDNRSLENRDLYNQGNEGWDYREKDGYRYLLRCRDIMTRDVTTCSPESSLREIADKMEDDDVGSIPVLENGRLIGLVTDRDIVCRVIAEGLDTRTTTARQAMTEDVVTCTPDESLMEAIHKMAEHQIRRLPICDPSGRLQGFISIGDIALEAECDRDLACALEQISQPTPNQSHRR
jgi:CBS domain-containing protein